LVEASGIEPKGLCFVRSLSREPAAPESQKALDPCGPGAFVSGSGSGLAFSALAGAGSFGSFELRLPQRRGFGSTFANSTFACAGQGRELPESILTNGIIWLWKATVANIAIDRNEAAALVLRNFSCGQTWIEITSYDGHGYTSACCFETEMGARPHIG
jgi:hypothetical protein